MRRRVNIKATQGVAALVRTRILLPSACASANKAAKGQEELRSRTISTRDHGTPFLVLLLLRDRLAPECAPIPP